MSILERVPPDSRARSPDSFIPLAGADASEHDMSVCPTCLTPGRVRLPLGRAARGYNILLSGLQNYEHIMNFMNAAKVCWECHRFLDKIVKFQRQVLDAGALLMSRVGIDKHETLPPFTNLSSSTNVGFNYKLQHQQNLSEVSLTSEEADADIKHEFVTDVSTSERRSNELKKKRDGTKRKYVKKKRWPTANVLLKGDNRNARVVSVNMSEEQFLRYREEDRRSDEYLNAPHKCTDCIKAFSFVNMLEKHRNNYHSESIGPHKCSICRMHFPSADRLRRHRQRHYKLYVCSACGFPQRRLPVVLRHYAAAHQPAGAYPCRFCGLPFQTYRKMHYHRDAMHKGIYRCEYCNKILSNMQSLKSHLLIHTGMPTLECSLCHKSCRGESGLDAHMRTAHSHENAEEAYCKECDIQFKSKKIYKVHLKQSPKHNPPTVFKFPCDKCDKKFITEAKLKHHHRTYHLDYICHICQKRLANGLSLDQHIKTVHEGRQLPRKHVCELCGKAFKSKTMLSEHRNVHTGDRPHACRVCGARFAQRSTLHTHCKLIHLKLGRGRAPPPPPPQQPTLYPLQDPTLAVTQGASF